MENLNDIPMELRPLAPFLQRAQELKLKDPTMSYWCTYYAVQQGVHLKPRDKQSRNYLMKLMAPLETIRSDSANNVVTSNDAACVYIEDFALRVFDAADNEDRRGEAIRGTAKKFLAAANFLELLKVFEEDTPSQASSSKEPNKTSSAFSQHREKIRYAKWKAADIAKAFREGRKPSPGPAHAPASVTSPGFEQGPEPANGVSSVGFPFDAPSHLSAPGSQYGRGSPSAHSSTTVSPQPGGSRNHSVSPAQKHSVLPMTSNSGGGYNGLGSGTNGNGNGYTPNIRTNGVASPPQSTSPTHATPQRPLGHARGRSLSQTQAPEGFNRPPIPPKDILSLTTPTRPKLPTQPLPGGSTSAPNTPGLYATPPNKNGASPGAWSTIATPGGFDARSGGTPANGAKFPEQSSPSRIPDNMVVAASRQQEDDTASYPPSPYPAVKLSPPSRPAMPGKKKAYEEGDDPDNWSTSGEAWASRQGGSFLGYQGREMYRQNSFASNAATVGGPSRQNSFAATPGLNGRQGSYGSGSATPTEGYYTNKLAAIMDEEKAAASLSASDRALEAAETDELAPLSGSRLSQKRVRWTASVVGGSTVGSSSPGNSPRSPAAELPALPESSDSNSSSGGDVRLAGDVKFSVPGAAPNSGAHTSPPTSVEEIPSSKPGAGAYVRATSPPVPRKPQFPNQTSLHSHTTYTYTPGPQTKALPSSLTSSPTINTSPKLAVNSLKNSPRTSPQGLPRIIPADKSAQQTPTPATTPNGSAFATQPSAPSSSYVSFPGGSAGTPPASSPSGTVSSLPGQGMTRHRRISSGNAPTSTNGNHPAIKPFVPLFGATASGGLPTPSGSQFSDRLSPRASPSPPASSGTPTQLPSRALSPENKVLPVSLPFRQITAAKKHSKFASSALEFDDLETARAELLMALAILNGDKVE